MTECPTCHGDGVVYHEPMDWWHGSGVNVEEYDCHPCGGTGLVVAEPSDPATEPVPHEDTEQAWAQADLDRALGRRAYPVGA